MRATSPSAFQWSTTDGNGVHVLPRKSRTHTIPVKSGGTRGTHGGQEEQKTLRRSGQPAASKNRTPLLRQKRGGNKKKRLGVSGLTMSGTLSHSEILCSSSLSTPLRLRSLSLSRQSIAFRNIRSAKPTLKCRARAKRVAVARSVPVWLLTSLGIPNRF